MDVGTTLGKYEIHGILGQGAMGVVYRGWDPVIARTVAIKTVAVPQNAGEEVAEQLARFRQEAQAAGRLHHPNIVGVYDCGEANGVTYIVMEFVEGRSLKALLEGEARLDAAQIRRVMQDLLRGLQYSHGRGVVHRDIKPENLIMTSENEVKIADFGIARIESSELTQAGTVMGTPAYMSPEQLMGQPLDGRTDLYSAGVILYQLVTGERPFTGSLSSLMHKVLHTDPPPPSALSVAAGPALDRVVARAMARRPADRFPNADAFLTDLLPALDLAPEAGPAAALPPGGEDATRVVRPPPPPLAATAAPSRAAGPDTGGARPARGGRTVLLAGMAGLALLAAGGAAFLLLSPARPAREVSGMPALPDNSAGQPAATGPEAPARTGPRGQGAPGTAAVPPPAPQGTAPADDAAASVAPGVPPAQPAPPSRPVMDAGAAQQALAAALAGVPCSLAWGSVAEPDAGVHGIAGAGAPEQALRQATLAALPGRDVAVAPGVFDGPYCGALDVLRPVAAGREPTLDLHLQDGRTRLAANDFILARLRMPFAGQVRLDYLSHDGTVLHMAPRNARQPALAAGAEVRAGDPGPSFNGWQVGPPYGTDMITALASATPLLDGPRPEVEPAGPYLAALERAVAAARARGVQVAASAMLVQTSEHR